ncbi:unnamed protein product [Paramecium pentaurelia]|uniref:Uncharacterized protein n=1 Tax=Paramecium pentaurelia TaxID=43138 RepID=A0A8S1Y560_9CILI|nr:unnamed protein product [Paramecium pentaurelia]
MVKIQFASIDEKEGLNGFLKLFNQTIKSWSCDENFLNQNFLRKNDGEFQHFKGLFNQLETKLIIIIKKQKKK